ncbi:hypothetical protein T484DRAFT_1888321 [Baffinella frigidus]|nr:hypothetical protein T484DRAFT_1888321 [Cryptophyta sp. CCMP2293]
MFGQKLMDCPRVASGKKPSKEQFTPLSDSWRQHCLRCPPRFGPQHITDGEEELPSVRGAPPLAHPPPGEHRLVRRVLGHQERRLGWVAGAAGGWVAGGVARMVQELDAGLALMALAHV